MAVHTSDAKDTAERVPCIVSMIYVLVMSFRQAATLAYAVKMPQMPMSISSWCICAETSQKIPKTLQVCPAPGLAELAELAITPRQISLEEPARFEVLPLPWCFENFLKSIIHVGVLSQITQ